MNMTYAEQLKHPNWQRKRLEILQRAGFKCERCEDGDRTLHVHHKRYRKGAKAWEYEDSELVALCEACHESEHLARRELTDLLAELDTGALEQVLGYTKAVAVSKEIAAKDWRWPVRTAFEVEGLGEGLGLTFMESQYLLARADSISQEDLERIGIAAIVRNTRAITGKGLAATSLAELESIGDALPPVGR